MPSRTRKPQANHTADLNADRDITFRELCALCDFSPEYISQIADNNDLSHAEQKILGTMLFNFQRSVSGNLTNERFGTPVRSVMIEDAAKSTAAVESIVTELIKSFKTDDAPDRYGFPTTVPQECIDKIGNVFKAAVEKEIPASSRKR